MPVRHRTCARETSPSDGVLICLVEAAQARLISDLDLLFIDCSANLLVRGFGNAFAGTTWPGPRRRFQGIERELGLFGAIRER